jgi:hypothetical protein
MGRITRGFAVDAFCLWRCVVAIFHRQAATIRKRTTRRKIHQLGHAAGDGG